jgi:hypothetical protein
LATQSQWGRSGWTRRRPSFTPLKSGVDGFGSHPQNDVAYRKLGCAKRVGVVLGSEQLRQFLELGHGGGLERRVNPIRLGWLFGSEG